MSLESLFYRLKILIEKMKKGGNTRRNRIEKSKIETLEIA
jgi:hypothetical protein